MRQVNNHLNIGCPENPLNMNKRPVRNAPVKKQGFLQYQKEFKPCMPPKAFIQKMEKPNQLLKTVNEGLYKIKLEKKQKHADEKPSENQQNKIPCKNTFRKVTSNSTKVLATNKKQNKQLISNGRFMRVDGKEIESFQEWDGEGVLETECFSVHSW